MIQAMQILQLGSIELQERIEQELVENPFLELKENEASDEEVRKQAEEPGELESMLEVLERYERDFGDGPRLRGGDGEEGDRKLEAMQNTPVRAHSLADALTEQLAFLDLGHPLRDLAQFVVESLDHRGYLTEEPEDLVALSELEGVEAADVQTVLGELRRVVHPSLGARDLRECLLLQLDAHLIEDPLVRTILLDHLDDIVSNRLPRIARATGADLEEVKEAIETIRSLDPNPGRDYGESPVAIILPDVVVEEEGGEFTVRLTRERVPRLQVSPSYRKLLQEAQEGDGVEQWVKKRLESARWFIDAVQQRQSTMQRIAQAIFDHQKGFLERGVSGLSPLRMQEIADEAGVHISTVSRAVSGKFAQTPRGIFPLKYFFTSGTAKASGGVASQTSIKQRIAEIVEQENKERPLSDDHIAELLEERDGIKIARRTVTKYRKALSIPASSQRRQF